ncbi:hypothetical protein Bbelb_371460, partial [Branchiostoma belcheri]
LTSHYVTTSVRENSANRRHVASQSCQNTSPLCGASPGWPLLSMCFDHDYVFASCPEFCGQCSCATDPRGPCYNGGTRGGNPANYNEHTCDCNCVGAWTGRPLPIDLPSLKAIKLEVHENSVFTQIADSPACTVPWTATPVPAAAHLDGTDPLQRVDYVAASCHAFCGICGGSGGFVTQPTTTIHTTKTTTTPPPCDWQVVFDVRPGVGDWAVDAWSSDHSHTAHLKSPLVKITLIQGAEIRELIFNGVNSDKFSWFSRDRLMYSPGRTCPQRPTTFSIQGGNPQARRPDHRAPVTGNEFPPAPPFLLQEVDLRQLDIRSVTSSGADIGVADRMIVSIDTCMP